ncbi:glycoprotein Xg isoform X1 [Lemur catta]|uniref:glycoprotein Xg isoform X1 n=1 Tax=Lemur catta TaxID=9447 RepID=UPI001E26A096|nr:glycoprotein Xg isoform X1 [Lemur catta]
MEIRWGLPCLAFLCFLMPARGQGDFDLADALDDPEPTKKPNSDIYPKPRPPPYHPQPGNPDHGGNIYPRPKPPAYPQPGNSDHGGGYFNDVDRDDGRYPPRPKPRPPAGGGGYGGGGYPSHDSSGSSYGRGGYRPKSPYSNTYGGDEHSTYGNPQGNMVARIVSPIVSVVVVTLLGAAASYFKLNRRRNCLRTNEPANV